MQYLSSVLLVVYLGWMKYVLHPLAYGLFWWRNGPIRRRAAADTTPKQQHVLVILESNGNGRFTQANNLLQMERFVPNGAIVTMAWDLSQRPVSDTTIEPESVHQIIHLATPVMRFDPQTGGVSALSILCSEILDVRSMLSYLDSWYHLVNYLHDHQVTSVINLFSTSAGVCSRIVPIDVPVYNIATQYIHLDLDSGHLHPRGQQCPPHLLLTLDMLVNLTRAVSPRGTHTLSIVPSPREGPTCISFPAPPWIEHIPTGCETPLSHSFVLVYTLNTYQSTRVFEVASQLAGTSFVYFSPLLPKPHHPNNVCLRPVHREAFLWYLQQPGAVVWTTGGYMLPCEAISMGRQCLLTPTLGHLEQQMNATYFQTHFPLQVRSCDPGTDETALLRTLLHTR